MRTILKTDYVKIPANVTVNVDQRHVTVKGPRGELKRSFRHLRLEVTRPKKNLLRVDAWFAHRKEASCVRSLCSHIENMIKGVTKGYQYKLRSVYAHFPINASIENKGKQITVRNFLGEKSPVVRTMPDGVTIAAGGKDEFVIEGNDVEKVGLAAANLHQCVLVKVKDIRKFLDGIYVSSVGTVVQDS